MCTDCEQCMSLLKLQGVVAAASFALCLYTCCRVKRPCSHIDNASTSPTVPEPSYMIKKPPKQPRMAINRLQLPDVETQATEKANANLDIVLMGRLLDMCEGVTRKDIHDEIAKQGDGDDTSVEQCTSALAYEFVGVIGSEKLQQAGATRLISGLAKVIDLKYIETMVALGCIDPVVLRSFDPMTVLAVLCLMFSNIERTSSADLLSIFAEHNIGPATALGAATAVRCATEASSMGHKDVARAINTLKTVGTRRSSRIRKPNK